VYYIGVNNIQGAKTMKNLIEILLTETASLKKQYIEKTKEWAEKKYKTVLQREHWKDVDWCKFLGVEPRKANEGTSYEFLTFPKGFFSTAKSKDYDRLHKEVQKLRSISLEAYLEKEEKEAVIFYNYSIRKLAGRIEKKELNVDNLKVKTAHIGVNIETVLTDGVKSVKAWTIIASGPVQRPHYRYLIK
jgi:hypothetical protein